MKIQKTVIVFSIILVALVSCKSSYTKIGDKNANYIPYYLKVYEADSLFIVGNYQKSYEILDSLFKKYEPVDFRDDDCRNYLISKDKVKKVNKKEVLKYIASYEYCFSILENDEPIQKLVSKLRISEEEILKKMKKNSKNVNVFLRKELIDMNFRDQKIRQTLNEDSIKKIDWQHSERLKGIIKKFGYPNKKQVGGYCFQEEKGNTNLIVIFNHISYNGDYQYFNKLLPDLVKKGECPPEIYAMLEDRRGEVFEREIKYFLIAKPNLEKVNSNEINKRRKEIGLPSLEYMNFKYKSMSN